MLKPQTIFNRAVTRLIKQDRQAVDLNGNCEYRGLNNTKCAVGILIPDKYYDSRSEGLMIVDDNNDTAVYSMCKESGLNLDSENVRNLLMDLQGMHDGFVPDSNYQVNQFADYVKDASVKIAKKHGLTPLAV